MTQTIELTQGKVTLIGDQSFARLGRNGYNRRKRRALTSSRYKGVCRVQGVRAWLAQIEHKGVHHRLGKFYTEAAAARAYNAAALKFSNGHAKLNVIDEAHERKQLKAVLSTLIGHIEWWLALEDERLKAVLLAMNGSVRAHWSGVLRLATRLRELQATA